MQIAYLHGFAGHPSAWSAGALAPSLPGHGGGPVLATWDANIAAVAKEIGACDAVVGYSLGARVAIGLVVGGFVPRAVLVSVNPGIADRDRAARRAGDAVWAKLLREHGTAAFLDAWEAQPLFATQARVPMAMRAARRAARLAHDPEQLARSLEVMGLAEMPDYRAMVAADRFALIAGADDAKYVEIARSLPAPLEVIAESGHDPTLEQPEALAAAISRALS
jgi:2-succinyl-6-hydroxy-2,4-cyclohexadiene-1-carboxylate synthase